MNYKNVLFFAWIFVVGLISCNPAEEEPAILTIENISLTTTEGQGEPTEKITDIWVSANDRPVGIYQVPSRIPIFEEGITELVIAPGIRVNGIQRSADQYTPMEFEIREVDLQKGVNNDPIDVEFKYRPETKFAFIEDFETGVNFFGEDLDEDPASFLMVTSTDVLSGSQSGVLRVGPDNPLNAVSTSVPVLGVTDAVRSIYLEMDYKFEQEIFFSVSAGLILNTGEVEVENRLTLRPQQEWNKVYYDISSALLQERLSAVTIILQAENTSDVEAGEVFLDNIKLVYE